MIELPWGVPVSERFAGPLDTVISEVIQSGEWNRIISDHEKDSKCQENVVDSEETPLYPKHLSGAYILSAGLVVLGIFASIIDRYVKDQKQGSYKEDKLPSTAIATDRVSLENSATGGQTKDISSAVASLTEKIASLEKIVVSNQQQQPEQNVRGVAASLTEREMAGLKEMLNSDGWKSRRTSPKRTRNTWYS